MAGAQPGLKPKVSAITIFYNAEAHIREAVDSVLAQDFTDFELILVDDGSTDSGTAIAKTYAQADPRIRYLEHPGHVNKGMSAARNLGLAAARGDLVAFIDADDRWRPSKLREQIELMDRLADVDAVGGSVNYWASHGGGRDRVVPTAHVRYRPIAPPEATLALYPLGKADAPSMSDLMFRRASILKVGGFEKAFRGAYEDQAFLAKFYLNSTLYITDALWSDYRLHDDSCMAEVGRNGTYHGTRRAFLKWFEAYLSSHGENADPLVHQALENVLRPYRAKSGRLKETVRRIPYVVPAVRAARLAYKGLRPMVAPGPAILMYHRIADEAFDPWQLAVSPANFTDHLEWIGHNRTPLPLEEFVAMNQRGKLPRDAIAVTFDDGYACNATAAAPLLERYQVPATIFLSASLIERGGEFWWDELERIVLDHKGDSLRVRGREITLGERASRDSDWQAGTPPATPRQLAYKEIWSLLYGQPAAELDEAMAQLREQARVPEEPRESHRPLTPAQIRGIRSDLVSFGSHALSHASLPELGPDEQAREIKESVSRCEAVTGTRPHSFAYPYGNHAPQLEPLVEQAGFVCACKADGWFVTRRTNRFALPRLFVRNSGAEQLAMMLGRP